MSVNPPRPAIEPRPHLGVLALGDSITNGGGGLQWGVAMKSWAEWVARGLGVPYSGCAVDGAVVGDVVGRQIAEFEARSLVSGGPFDVGCLYVGVNDVRRDNWDAERFADGYSKAVSWLRARCDRVVCVTAPLDLGRPRAGAKVRELNAVVVESAVAAGALVLDLAALRARNLVMSDRVHLTAFGQVWVAERALGVLAADGMEVRALPSRMISYEVPRWGRLRADVDYAWRCLKGELRGRL